MSIRQILPLVVVLFILPASAAGQDDLSPRDSLLLLRADSVLAQGEPSRAIGLYREILSRYPESFWARYGMARAFLNQGEPSRALPYLNELIIDYPTEADPRVIRGYGYLHLGRLTDAEEDFRWVADRFPEYSDAWQGLGFALERSGEQRRAVEVYSRWIAADPQDSRPFLARARLFASLGRSADARADLESARILGASAAGAERVEATLEAEVRDHEVQVAAAYEILSFFGKQEHWEAYSAHALYSVERLGALAVEYNRTSRFAKEDEALQLDLTANLWQASYLFASWQHSREPNFLPIHDLYIELHQSIQEGWVPSVLYRHMGFSNVKANFYGVGLEKNADPWYGKVRFAIVNALGRKSPVLLSHFRYYFSLDTYMAAHLGYGSEVVAVGLGPEIRSGTNLAASLLLHSFVTRHFGFAIASMYTHSNILPDHAGANIRLMVRF